MSDYTPTTEEIRKAYTNYTQPSLSDNGELFYGTSVEFDRWLIQERQRVAEMAIAKERERIVANILDRVNDLRSCHKNDDCREWGERIESYISEWTETK